MEEEYDYYHKLSKNNGEHRRHDDDHKKKKKHKQSKSRDDRSRSRQHESSHHRKKKYSRSKEKSIDNEDRKNKHKDHHKDHHRDHKDRDNYRNQEKEKQKEKDPYFEQRRQIEKLRKHNPQKAEKLQNQLEKKMIFEKKNKQYEEMKQKFKQAQKEMEQAKRQDHTILVYCLPLKAKQKDIWNFFFKSGCGKIRDIRLIKDGRSGKSKGVAYVEFYTSQSVEKALTLSERPFELNGRQFSGLRVQHSQAQKNRAAAAAKQMRVIKPVDPLEQAQQNIRKQMKVLVGGLIDKLAEIQQSQLKQLFEPFGQIAYVDIIRDSMTGKCKGYAFIQYTSTEDAKAAVKEMNGLVVGGQKITVQTVNFVQKGEVSAGDDYLHSAGNKSVLMNRLSRGDAPTHSNLMRPPISTVSTPYLLMSNLFTMEGTSPGFFEDLKKQVMGACANYGIVQKIFIQKNNQGNVWVKFSDTQSAVKAQESLNGKFFDDKKVFCYFVTEATYQSRVGI